MRPPVARILIEIDKKVTGEVPLNKPLLNIGRLSGSDIYIASKQVSRLHARIRAEAGAWVIEDAGSVNGLIYRDSQVQRLALTHGDRVYLAPEVALLYETAR